MTLPSASDDLTAQRACEAPSLASQRRPLTISCARVARVAAMTTGVALLAGLGACGGKADATPTGIQQSDIDRIAAAASHRASASASAGSSSTTSGTASPVDYTIPAAAKAHTKEGAKAFVEFYWETLGKLEVEPRTGVIEKFSSPACKSCAMQADSANRLVNDHAHVEVNNRQLTGFTIRPDSVSDSVVVTFRLNDDGGWRVSARGKEAIPPNHKAVAARADWDGSTWKLGAAGADPS